MNPSSFFLEESLCVSVNDSGPYPPTGPPRSVPHFPFHSVTDISPNQQSDMHEDSVWSSLSIHGLSSLFFSDAPPVVSR